MRGVSIPAWHAKQYVSLAEVLGVVESTLPNLRWRIQVEELAPEPDVAGFGTTSPERDLTTAELRALAAQAPQIVDGAVRGFLGTDVQPWIIIQAVDSTSWDISSVSAGLLAQLQHAYSGAVNIPEDGAIDS